MGEAVAQLLRGREGRVTNSWLGNTEGKTKQESPKNKPKEKEASQQALRAELVGAAHHGIVSRFTW